ncbi:hypothetical protein [Bradyrhizobium sp. RT4b]|uniref:hypothetical protein n=1 Tax=Bradyrhizobium sp. RT4b TaxID=3156379 RepID=UPI003398D5EA
MRVIDRDPFSRVACAHFGRIEIGPHVGAAVAALAADQFRLEIRQANMVGPFVGLIRRNPDHVAAARIEAENQEGARAAGAGAHFAERDLLLAPRHGVGTVSSSCSIMTLIA